jgi:hypothetical protein
MMQVLGSRPLKSPGRESFLPILVEEDRHRFGHRVPIQTHLEVEAV